MVLTCPKCSQRMLADESAVGKRLRCPACRHVFVAALRRATVLGGAVSATEAAAALGELASAEEGAEPGSEEASEVEQSEALDELRQALRQAAGGGTKED